MHRMLKGAACLAIVASALFAGAAIAQPADPGGVFVAGDIWETFLPTNVGKTYYEIADDPNNTFHLFRVGNLDRQWTTPTQMYPGGENLHIPWKQEIEMIEYNPRPGFNNFTTATDPKAEFYAYGFHTSKLQQNNDYQPIWSTDAASSWVDPNSRTQVLYQGGTPTNLGVNVNYRIRQYTVNHANMNDFIALELELTNTGILDVDGDGNPEATDNKINALVLNMRHELINSMSNSSAGRRGASGWFTGPVSGYDATPDADGNPHDTPVIFTGPAPGSLDETLADGRLWGSAGKRILGNTMNRRRNYYDVYTGMQWIAAKQGPLDAPISSAMAADKKTIFDSHPVGTGAQQGWYTSVNRGYGNSDHFPWVNHTLSMGTFYEIGGKQFDATSFKLLPDPNYFDTTHPDIVEGNPLTFVNAVLPEAMRGQPRGDMKYNNTFAQNWEINNPDPADDWVNGYSIGHAFDGDHYVGIGPFSLEVGETINLVLVEYGGFRLQGVRGARKAAQWAYENGWSVPEPPPSPNIIVGPNTNQKVTVKWDNVAESAPDFAGYKVYRSTIFPSFNSLELGTRMLDTYHTQTTENPTDAQLAALGKPNNPNIDAPADWYRTQAPGAWGSYRLIKNITAAELASFRNTDADASTYQNAFEDANELVQFGFGYYYYVAAYDNESGEIAGQPFTTLESHRQNFNGRSGLWEGTHHYATANAFYPDGNDLDGLKRIGAQFILKAPLVNPQDLISGNLAVRVQPNPYKKQALHDQNTEHKLLFTNLPTGTKITILDVSGQVIDVIQFGGTNPFDGTLFWDMFSKDGIEVTSGLYIYVAEYPGGKQTGHFAILR